MHGLLQALCVYRQPCPYTGLHRVRARRAAGDQGHVACHQIPAGRRRRQHSGPPVHDGARNGRNGRGAPTGAGAPGAGACGGGRQRGRPPAPRCHTCTPYLYLLKHTLYVCLTYTRVHTNRSTSRARWCASMCAKRQAAQVPAARARSSSLCAQAPANSVWQPPRRRPVCDVDRVCTTGRATVVTDTATGAGVWRPPRRRPVCDVSRERESVLD